MLVLVPVAHAAESDQAKEILAATGVKGGVIVHIGCGEGGLTTALRANASYLVQGLDADAAKVEKARQQIRAQNLYGPVSVEPWKGPLLPYNDNLVNLVVAENLGGVSMGEVMRVLAPNGVAYIRKDGQWTKTVKPRPADIPSTNVPACANTSDPPARPPSAPPKRIAKKRTRFSRGCSRRRNFSFTTL